MPTHLFRHIPYRKHNLSILASPLLAFPGER